jgi:hypothetical protein
MAWTVEGPLFDSDEKALRDGYHHTPFVPLLLLLEVLLILGKLRTGGARASSHAEYGEQQGES